MGDKSGDYRTGNRLRWLLAAVALALLVAWQGGNDDWTAADVFTVQEASQDSSVVGGYEGEVVSGVCTDGWCGVRLQRSIGVSDGTIPDLDSDRSGFLPDNVLHQLCVDMVAVAATEEEEQSISPAASVNVAVCAERLVSDGTPTEVVAPETVQDVSGGTIDRMAGLGSEPDRADTPRAADSVGIAAPTSASSEVQPEPGSQGVETLDAYVSFYACQGDQTGAYCGRMANGRIVHPGAAACGYAFELGRRFRIMGDPTGRTYLCEDRGLGPYVWVEPWFQTAAEGWAWLKKVGTQAVVEVLE